MPLRRSGLLSFCVLLVFFLQTTEANTTPRLSPALNERNLQNNDTIINDIETDSSVAQDTDEEDHHEGGSDLESPEEEEHSNSNGLDFPLLDGDSSSSSHEESGGEHEGGEEHEDEAAHAVLFPSFTMTIGLIVFFLLTR